MRKAGALLRLLSAAPAAQCLRGVSINSKTYPAHALGVAEADLQGDLVEWLARVFNTWERGLPTKALDGTRRRFARFRGELARELARAYPCHVSQLLDRQVFAEMCAGIG